MAGFRILPVLIVFAALCFGVRMSDLMRGVARAGSIEAYAAEPSELDQIMTAAGDPPPASELRGADEPDAPPKPDAPKVGKADAAKGDATQGDTTKGDAAKADAGKPAKPKLDASKKTSDKDWKDSGDLDDEYSDVKMELFADLAKRRKDVETKEKELAMREALLKAAQAELQQKTHELTTIKADIEALLKQQTEQEDKRIASLVKIYEGMKAKDAARIFDSLETDVLLQVMTKMSERKSAPILAAMNPDKARSITIMLAEQNKLPQLPSLPMN